MAGQGTMLYRNDKLFELTKNNSLNSSVIVVTNQGEIRIGHDNYIGRNYRNDYSFEPPWIYVYFETITQKLLEDILLEKDTVKGLTRHYQSVPSEILTYLLNADLKELKNALDYYKEITKPKKYILIRGGCNEYEDEMKISRVEDFYEAQQVIEREFEHENYFGFFNVNLRNSGYWFSVIVSDDEKMNCKYRDALTFDEFVEVCKKKFDDETINRFDQVWNLQTKGAEKYWKKDKYEEDGQTFYSESYSDWRNY